VGTFEKIKNKMKKNKLATILMLAGLFTNLTIMGQSKITKKNEGEDSSAQVHYRKVIANGQNIFYREAGAAGAPTILLLHGYPTSSHMFRELIPMLSGKYRVLAPDLPGFGYSDAPDREKFKYTFDNLTKTMQSFVDKLGLKRFAIYVFDYGAPTGFRLALANPEKITGIISQNGNAYVEGLSNGWNPMQKYWEHDTKENRDALRTFVTAEQTRFQYFTGVEDTTMIAPESYTLDQHFLNRPESAEIQLDLLNDYKTNVALYPKFQEYFRTYKPKFLAVWGNRDPFFLPAGAEAYKRDMPDAIVKFYNTGHFALETHVKEIGNEILNFLTALPQ
jgi:pimeloyl-ACP methyl ester carboxylesterase